jgi:hypothetical protein
MATATKKKTSTKKAIDDLIVNVSHEIENYEKAKAYDTVKQLAEDIEFSYFKVGGTLNRINEEGWYSDEGFGKFSEFVEAEFGIKRTKAMYLINIYRGLLTSGVAWEDVKDVGWSKLKEIVSVLTKQNVKSWVKRANEMTVLQLNAYVRAHKAGESGGSDADHDSGVPTVSSMTFKMHDDQKDVVTAALDKAKDESGTEHNNVALEAICTDYLAGPSTPKSEAVSVDDLGEPTLETLQTMMENFNYIQVLETFEKIWPEIDVAVTPPE